MQAMKVFFFELRNLFTEACTNETEPIRDQAGLSAASVGLSRAPALVAAVRWRRALLIPGYDAFRSRRVSHETGRSF